MKIEFKENKNLKQPKVIRGDLDFIIELLPNLKKKHIGGMTINSNGELFIAGRLVVKDIKIWEFFKELAEDFEIIPREKENKNEN